MAFIPGRFPKGMLIGSIIAAGISIALWFSHKLVLRYLSELMLCIVWGVVGWTGGANIHLSWLPAPVLPIALCIIGFLLSAITSMWAFIRSSFVIVSSLLEGE
jgi:hypothetical protein